MVAEQVSLARHVPGRYVSYCAGQATIGLLKQVPQDEGSKVIDGFDQVIGVDPSPKMVAEAQAWTATLGLQNSSVAFVQSPAEDLHFVEDQSVDLVIAGTISRSHISFLS